MAAREPVFNLSERFPIWMSGGLVIVWALMRVLPAGLVYEIERLTVLKPLGQASGAEFAALLGHGIQHVGLQHLLLNVVGLFWFGTLTLRGLRARSVRAGTIARPEPTFLLILACGVIMGGLAQWAWWIASDNSAVELVGASGGVSAILATGIYAVAGRVVMLRFAVVWAMVNILLVVLTDVSGGNAGWPAHIGGYLAGMGLAARYVTPRSTGIGVT